MSRLSGPSSMFWTHGPNETFGFRSRQYPSSLIFFNNFGPSVSVNSFICKTNFIHLTLPFPFRVDTLPGASHPWFQSIATMSFNMQCLRSWNMRVGYIHSKVFIPARLGSLQHRLRYVDRHLCRRRQLMCSLPGGTANVNAEAFSVATEMERARKEARPYNIDKTKLTPREREQLRLRSKAIPLVADKEPLDIVFEDDRFLVVNKPSYLKMHPSHRFEGGSLLNRAIGHCGVAPKLLHRLDMVRRSCLDCEDPGGCV